MRTRIKLKLGDKSYELNPGPGALRRIASEVGDPVQMVAGLEAGARLNKTPPLTTVVPVFHIALEESEYEVDRDELWELVFAEGALKILQPFAQFMMALVNAGKLPETRTARRAKKAVARRQTGKTKKS